MRNIGIIPLAKKRYVFVADFFPPAQRLGGAIRKMERKPKEEQMLSGILEPRICGKKEEGGKFRHISQNEQNAFARSAQVLVKYRRNLTFRCRRQKRARFEDADSTP